MQWSLEFTQLIQNPTIAMKGFIYVAVLVVLAASTVVPHEGPIDSHVPLTYKVSLNDPPEVRWAPIVRDFKEPFERFMEFIDILPIPKGFYDGVEWYARNEFKYQDFVAEIDALAKLTGYPFQKLFFYNFFYEFSTVPICTGFLVRNLNGTVMHGRNLDFQMWQLISKLLVTVDYYKDGKLLYSSDTVAATVFALTGIRRGAFSINVDTRYHRNFQDTLISVIKNGHMPTCWLLRKVFEEESNYADASKRLRTENISASVYFIIAGLEANEGMVIQRDPVGTHAYYELSESTWFLVQTNYDRDQPDPVYDPRRIPMEKRVQDRGQNFTKDTVLTEMFKWPNFNIATIMTAVMVPKEGYHNVTAWYGYNPTPKTYLSQE